VKLVGGGDGKTIGGERSHLDADLKRLCPEKKKNEQQRKERKVEEECSPGRFKFGKKERTRGKRKRRDQEGESKRILHQDLYVGDYDKE